MSGSTAAVHRENRTVPTLVLEVAKNGPRLGKTEAGEASTNSSRGRIDARKTSMDRFADVLARQLDLPVVNQTGLDSNRDCVCGRRRRLSRCSSSTTRKDLRKTDRDPIV